MYLAVIDVKPLEDYQLAFVYVNLKVVLPHNWLLQGYHQRYIIYLGDVYEI